MDNQLQSISKIFTEKLFRIPDYQRGYAWGDKQLKDFWNDIIQLEENQNHYVGVLTLEVVPKNKWQVWEDDKWIIDSKNYQPFYVVDGQQRLTTTIVLIQSITEIIGKSTKLNYTSAQEIKKKFIFDSKDNGISRSYIFGYEKDNPSYEFLKMKIFLESSGGYRDEETIYTQNLISAKQFFSSRLQELEKQEIEIVYKKVTQQLLFNIYSISEDIDVFVAFESMNNRGKPLSNLELLKNRLIYLSTKFDGEQLEKDQLRKRINDSWKAVYHYLGKNKDRPLSDDTFLVNHFIVYFGKDVSGEKEEKFQRMRRYYSYMDLYDKFLLEDKFTLKQVKSETPEERLSIQDINNYIQSLQECVKVWYNVFNPTECRDFDDDEVTLLDKMFRLFPREYAPLLLIFYSKKPNKNTRIKFLKSLERQIFIQSFSYKFYYFSEYAKLAIELSKGDIDIQGLLTKIEEISEKIVNTGDFIEFATSRFKNEGFYSWDGLKYFLFEYELHLKNNSKTKRSKIDWRQYATEKEEFITVEHIYPQKAKDTEWLSFKGLTTKQKKQLCNSLGNLLPLSKPKNSSLQNNSFSVKVDNEKNKIGYRYGSYSENEISKLKEWTPDSILQRGIKLLEFLETRWNINIGDNEKKQDVLGLSFLKEQTS